MHRATRSRSEEIQALKNLIASMPGFSAAWSEVICAKEAAVPKQIDHIIRSSKALPTSAAAAAASADSDVGEPVPLGDEAEARDADMPDFDASEAFGGSLHGISSQPLRPDLSRS